jgi:hypothetical protein
MPAAPPPRRSRRWIGFFVVLGVLAVTAMVVPLVYNLSIQLHPEQLAEARRRWKEYGPSNYDLEYLVKSTKGGQEEVSQYLVKVRDGWVILVANDGEILLVDPTLANLAGTGVLACWSGDPRSYGVPALLDEVERGLEFDEKKGKRIYSAKAHFDPQNGHPYHYVRRRLGTKEQMEWNVIRLTPVGDGKDRHD